jgi:hypothetical protein
MIDRIGGVEIAKAALARFRDKTRSAGFPDLHLNAVAWGLTEMTGLRQLLPALNVKSVTSYSWVHHDSFPAFPASEYRGAADRAVAYWMKAKDIFGF